METGMPNLTDEEVDLEESAVLTLLGLCQEDEGGVHELSRVSANVRDTGGRGYFDIPKRTKGYNPSHRILSYGQQSNRSTGIVPRPLQQHSNHSHGFVLFPQQRHERLSNRSPGVVPHPQQQHDQHSNHSRGFVLFPQQRHEQLSKPSPGVVPCPQQQHEQQIKRSPVPVRYPQQQHEQQINRSPVPVRYPQQQHQSPVPLQCPQQQHEQINRSPVPVRYPQQQHEQHINQSPVAVSCPQQQQDQQINRSPVAVSCPQQQQDQQINRSPVAVPCPQRQQDQQSNQSPGPVPCPRQQHEQQSNHGHGIVQCAIQQHEQQSTQSPRPVPCPQQQHEQRSNQSPRALPCLQQQQCTMGVEFQHGGPNFNTGLDVGPKDTRCDQGLVGIDNAGVLPYSEEPFTRTQPPQIYNSGFQPDLNEYSRPAGLQSYGGFQPTGLQYSPGSESVNPRCSPSYGANHIPQVVPRSYSGIQQKSYQYQSGESRHSEDKIQQITNNHGLEALGRGNLSPHFNDPTCRGAGIFSRTEPSPEPQRFREQQFSPCQYQVEENKGNCARDGILAGRDFNQEHRDSYGALSECVSPNVNRTDTGPHGFGGLSPHDPSQYLQQKSPQNNDVPHRGAQYNRGFEDISDYGDSGSADVRMTHEFFAREQSPANDDYRADSPASVELKYSETGEAYIGGENPPLASGSYQESELLSHNQSLERSHCFSSDDGREMEEYSAELNRLKSLKGLLEVAQAPDGAQLVKVTPVSQPEPEQDEVEYKPTGPLRSYPSHESPPMINISGKLDRLELVTLGDHLVNSVGCDQGMNDYKGLLNVTKVSDVSGEMLTHQEAGEFPGVVMDGHAVFSELRMLQNLKDQEELLQRAADENALQRERECVENYQEGGEEEGYCYQGDTHEEMLKYQGRQKLEGGQRQESGYQKGQGADNNEEEEVEDEDEMMKEDNEREDSAVLTLLGMEEGDNSNVNNRRRETPNIATEKDTEYTESTRVRLPKSQSSQEDPGPVEPRNVLLGEYMDIEDEPVDGIPLPALNSHSAQQETETTAEGEISDSENLDPSEESEGREIQATDDVEDYLDNQMNQHLKIIRDNPLEISNNELRLGHSSQRTERGSDKERHKGEIVHRSKDGKLLGPIGKQKMEKWKETFPGQDTRMERAHGGTPVGLEDRSREGGQPRGPGLDVQLEKGEDTSLVEGEVAIDRPCKDAKNGKGTEDKSLPASAANLQPNYISSFLDFITDRDVRNKRKEMLKWTTDRDQAEENERKERRSKQLKNREKMLNKTYLYEDSNTSQIRNQKPFDDREAKRKNGIFKDVKVRLTRLSLEPLSDGGFKVHGTDSMDTPAEEDSITADNRNSSYYPTEWDHTLGSHSEDISGGFGLNILGVREQSSLLKSSEGTPERIRKRGRPKKYPIQGNTTIAPTGSPASYETKSDSGKLENPSVKELITLGKVGGGDLSDFSETSLDDIHLENVGKMKYIYTPTHKSVDSDVSSFNTLQVSALGPHGQSGQHYSQAVNMHPVAQAHSNSDTEDTVIFEADTKPSDREVQRSFGIRKDLRVLVRKMSEDLVESYVNGDLREKLVVIPDRNLTPIADKNLTQVLSRNLALMDSEDVASEPESDKKSKADLRDPDWVLESDSSSVDDSDPEITPKHSVKPSHVNTQPVKSTLGGGTSSSQVVAYQNVQPQGGKSPAAERFPGKEPRSIIVKFLNKDSIPPPFKIQLSRNLTEGKGSTRKYMSILQREIKTSALEIERRANLTDGKGSSIKFVSIPQQESNNPAIEMQQSKNLTERKETTGKYVSILKLDSKPFAVKIEQSKSLPEEKPINSSVKKHEDMPKLEEETSSGRTELAEPAAKKPCMGRGVEYQDSPQGEGKTTVVKPDQIGLCSVKKSTSDVIKFQAKTEQSSVYMSPELSNEEDFKEDIPAQNYLTKNIQEPVLTTKESANFDEKSALQKFDIEKKVKLFIDRLPRELMLCPKKVVMEKERVRGHDWNDRVAFWALLRGKWQRGKDPPTRRRPLYAAGNRGPYAFPNLKHPICNCQNEIFRSPLPARKIPRFDVGMEEDFDPGSYAYATRCTLCSTVGEKETDIACPTGIILEHVCKGCSSKPSTFVSPSSYLTPPQTQGNDTPAESSEGHGSPTGNQVQKKIESTFMESFYENAKKSAEEKVVANSCGSLIESAVYVDVCDFCEYHPISLEDMVRHSWSEHEDCTCHICNINFTMPEQFYTHLKLHKACDVTYCLICGGKADNFFLHLYEEHESNSCAFCGLMLTSRTHYEEHLENIRLIKFESGKYLCPKDECGFTIYTLDLLLKHMWDFHGQKTCPICCDDNLFVTLDDLLSHISGHAGYALDENRDEGNSEFWELVSSGNIEEPFKTMVRPPKVTHMCNFCGLKFSSLLKLTKHRWFVHGNTLPDANDFYFPAQLAISLHLENLNRCTCWECGQEEKDLSELAEHLWDEHEYHGCVICFERCNNSMRLETHLECHKKREFTKENCPYVICDDKFTDLHELVMHQWVTHGERRCLYCDVMCESQEHFWNHALMHNCSEIPCSENWMSYLSRTNSQLLNIKCPLCSFSGPSADILYVHLFDEHGARKCLLCHDYLISADSVTAPDPLIQPASIKDYILHMSEHQAHEQSLVCTLCGLKSLTHEDTITHAHAVHGILPQSGFKCQRCREMFSSFADVANHINEVHENWLNKMNQVFTCPVCNIDIQSNRLFNLHKQRCFVIPCGECGVEFSSWASLKEHQLTHVFGCAACDQVFTSSDGLLAHKRTHHGLV